jgi:uncharacterized BrkB/YihY/UPF0761 family membrane protein
VPAAGPQQPERRAAEAPPAEKVTLRRRATTAKAKYQGTKAKYQERYHDYESRYQELAARRPVLGLPLVFLERYVSRQGILLASALAFRLFMWLVPLALLLAGILAAFATGDDRGVRDAAAAAGITGALREQIVQTLHEGHGSWWIAVSFGAVLFWWGSRTLARSLTLVNAHVWAVPAKRNKQVLTFVLIFTAGWVAIVASSVFHLDELIPAGVVLATLVEGAAIAALWLPLCMRLPDKRNDWLDLVPGCLFFGYAMSILHTVSRVYIPLRLERSSRLYGSLGLATVILAWLLIIGQVIVSGALMNSVWSDYRAQRRQIDMLGSGAQDLDGRPDDPAER